MGEAYLTLFELPAVICRLPSTSQGLPRNAISNSRTTFSMSVNPPAITDAGAPFDNPDADVILRSSDKADFRFFKLLLSLASPVFKDLFALPQVPDGNDTKDGLPIVQLTEGGRTLRMLLTMCYPMTVVDQPDTGPEKIADLRLLLNAAHKYDISKVVERVRVWIVTPLHMESSPVMAYAIACQRNWEVEARVAARCAVGLTLLDRSFGKQIDIMTTRQLHALLRYNEMCITAMQKAVITCAAGPPTCKSCGNPESGISKWAVRYMGNVAKAVVNNSWHTVAERRRLVEVAVAEAQQCIFCRPLSSKSVRSLEVILIARMEKAASKVSPFSVRYPSSTFDKVVSRLYWIFFRNCARIAKKLCSSTLGSMCRM